MFNFNKDLNKIREINGIRDSLIPFLISSLSQNQNIFYVAKNDLELSNIYNFLSPTPLKFLSDENNSKISFGLLIITLDKK